MKAKNGESLTLVYEHRKSRPGRERADFRSGTRLRSEPPVRNICQPLIFNGAYAKYRQLIKAWQAHLLDSRPTRREIPQVFWRAQSETDRGSSNFARGHVESGRLMSLKSWLELLAKTDT